MEWARIEFKETWDPAASLKTICAFADDLDNWGGGYIVIGVKEEDGHPVYPLKGVPIDKIDKYQKEIFAKCKFIRPAYMPIIDKKQEYQDNTDRIEVERTFSLSKRCYGMGCITTKLKETQLASVALSVFVTNLFKIQKRILCALLYLFRFWDKCKYWSLQMSY